MVLCLMMVSVWSTNSFAAKSALSPVVDRLTIPTILVRTDLKPCLPKNQPEKPELEQLAGATLESYYQTELTEFAKKNYTVANWEKENKGDCQKDCSCFARSRIWDQYSEEDKTKLGAKTFEEPMAKMTDDDYKTCRAKIKNFCARPEVKRFMKAVKAANSK